MSGVSLALSIAKSALFSNSYGLDVTAHNLSNVNNPNYSRQMPVFEAIDPAPFAGNFLGRGVNVKEIRRIKDQFIEKRLMEQQSNMYSLEEMENYMKILEGIFNETSENSISSMMSTFFTLWQDIANNPSGASERIAIYEHGILMCEQFKSIKDDLVWLQDNLTSAIKSGIEKINELTESISHLNSQIVSYKSGYSANDLKDKRDALISELSNYINIKVFEHENGSVTIITSRGCPLVQGTGHYNLTLCGENGDRIGWEGSGDQEVDITDYITKGKMAGWLEMRDEILEKYKRDLDSLVKELIWHVNRQHSQGVGIETFTEVKGTYAVSSEDTPLGSEDSSLPYYDKITDGSFSMWIYDQNGNMVGGGPLTFNIDTSSTTLNDLIDDMNSQISSIGADISVDSEGGYLKIVAENGYNFGFSDDSSYVLAALGINTFFNGSTAGNISINGNIGENKSLIAASKIDSDGDIYPGDNSNAIELSELKNQDIEISQWNCDRIEGVTEGTVLSRLEEYYHSLISSIGIVSKSIKNGREFNEVLVNKLTEIRDSISGVSIDEEMTTLLQYQQSYTAAAKLISITDEMLETLMSIR